MPAGSLSTILLVDREIRELTRILEAGETPALPHEDPKTVADTNVDWVEMQWNFYK